MRAGRILVIVFGALVAIALLGTVSMGMMGGAWFGGMIGPGMMSGYAGPNGAGGPWGWMMLAGTVSMAAFWGAIILGIALLVRWLAGPTADAPAATAGDALAILGRRYATGEIDQTTYERMKRELTIGAAEYREDKAA